VLLGLLGTSRTTQDAVANGETRTLNIYHTHSKESAQVTFKRDGRYDPQALDQLNWLLRDWRLDKATKMDPRLFDIVWQVYREVGAREPVNIVSAYRAPETNSMLRRRSRAVSEHSQHMLGKAMDFSLPDVGMDRVRAVAMRLQYGGVGYYPSSRNAFVHLDVGSVRAWPRMTRDQLVRLFPDGKTVHLPADGTPLPRYEEARAEILARGGSVAGTTAYADAGEDASPRKSLWASLFGRDDEDGDDARGRGRGTPGTRVAAYAPTSTGEDAGTRGFAPAQRAPEQPAARRGRRGGTEVAALPEPAAASGGEGFNPLRVLLDAPAPEAAGLPTAGPAFVPVPPRRPEDIPVVAGLTEAPLPPSRPIALASAGVVPLADRSGAVAPALVAASPVTTAVAPAAPPLRTEALLQAAPAAPGPDRGALRALFATALSPSAATEARKPVATARAKAQPITAASLTTASLTVAAGPVLSLGFSAKATDLSTAAFTGPAVKALPVLR
jgi:uncharacterized protein YcbK (DUF882 family)